MLIVLKAKGCADVILLEDAGREILHLLGKERSAAQGIVTVEQLPGAIAGLARAAALGRASPEVAASAQPVDEGEGKDTEPPPVQLFQRAQPVLLLLEQALQARTPVTWGV